MASDSASENCEHGKWNDGVCVCDEGYVSDFTSKELYPVYCTKKLEEVTIVLTGNEFRDVLNYIAIAVTLFFAISGILVFSYFWYTNFDTYLLHLRIKRAKKKLEDFQNNILRREPNENLNAELWYPDMSKYVCINDPEFSVEKAMWTKMQKKMMMVCASVIYDYKPEKEGELKLKVGDIITNVEKMQNGWCKGKLDGKTGYYPEAYAHTFETMVDADGKPILDYAAQGLDPYYGLGMMPPNQGLGMMPPNQGLGMMPPNQGLGMMPPNQGGLAPYFDPMVPLGAEAGGDQQAEYYADPYYQQMMAGMPQEIPEGYSEADYQQYLQQMQQMGLDEASAWYYGGYPEYYDTTGAGEEWQNIGTEQQVQEQDVHEKQE